MKKKQNEIVSPVARQMSNLPEARSFEEVLQLIQAAKQRAYQAVNTEIITLYWQVGEYIGRKIETDGWGKGTIQNLGSYLQNAQPGIRGFSPQNIWRMRQFYQSYREQPILSALLRELPWTHHMLILGRTKIDEEREFYIRLAIREKWSSRELERQLNTARFERTILNPIKVSPVFQELHPETANIFKDIYSLEFLGLPAEHSEADLHGGLLRNLGRFITELGRDFCFIGSEHPIQVGGQDFSLDLLFFHRGLNCLIAIELKIREFRPEDLGKLNFYLEALDRDHRKPHENPSIGLLLCATKDQEVVEYALSRSLSPALIAEYETLLPDKALLRAKLHEFYQLCAPPDDEDKEPEIAKSARGRKKP
jgi:predicted nuclease of restriction endonuclease-like (RecB) superfamily